MALIYDVHNTRVWRVPSITQHEGDPTASDDATRGHSACDQWVNTAQLRCFACIRNDPGAAVWRVLARPAGRKQQPPPERVTITRPT